MKRDSTGKFVYTWDGERKRAVKISLTATAWEILEKQSQAQGISRSELVETYARHLQAYPTHQQLQQRIVEIEQQFEKLAENTLDLISRVDAGLRYLYVSPTFQQAMGVSAPECVGKTNREIGMPTEICQQWNEAWQWVFASGREYTFEFKLSSPKHDRWFQTRLIPELVSNGKVQSILSISRDITDSKLAERTLQQTEERLQIALRSANAIVWDMDLQSNGVIYSGSAVSSWGILEGTVEAFFAIIHPEDRHNAMQALERAIAGDKHYAQEYRIIRPDGTTRWLSSRGKIYLDAKQIKPIRMVGISIDITERKFIEEALRQSKERLRAANERFRLAAMAVNCLIYDWDIEQDYVERTEGLTEILGYSLDEAEPTGNWWRQLIHPDDLKQVAQQAQTDLALGDQCKAEYRVLNKDNEYVYILDQCLVVTRDVNGVPTRIVGSTTNITDRKRTEAALAESNQTLQAIIQACPLAIMGLRADGTVRIWNPAAERTFGWSQSEVIDQFLPAIPIDKREEFLNNLATTIQGEGLTGVETQRQTKDTTLIDVQLWSASLDEAQAGISCLSVVADIRDRKQTEAALRRSEERLRMALDAGKAGVWDWDILNNRITWSERIYEFHGMTPETFGGTMEEFSNLIHPDDQERVFAQVQQALQTQEPYQVELRALHTNGAVRWLTTSGRAFYHEGQPVRMLGATLDITDRKQAEVEREELLQRERESREAAETANRIKDEFLAVLSHELRSPLNPILGWTRLLRTRSFDSQATDRALETIERNAKLQAQLIEDLLDVSRILQGKLSLHASPVSLVATIEAALETVQLSAEAKAIDLRFAMSDELKADEQQAANFKILGDSARLQQVIWNILSNAIKFTPNGGRVEVKLESDEFSTSSSQLEIATQTLQRYAQITITDTGQGIAPDFLPYVFDYFRQADSSTTRQFGGLGLGLAIVRHLVELHGGTVKADSPGKGLGATFTIQLPLLNDRPIQSSHPAKPRESVLPQPLDSSISLAGIQILVVDDEPDMRDLIHFILSRQGASVRVAASAPDALKLCAQSIPDVLISDIGMPKVDGYMLMQQLRQRPIHQGGQVPAIALTAYAGEFNQKRALAAGFQLHITKPIEPIELVKTITTLLSKS